MRRRLRQQSRMREALLVDLGALVYELHRHGRREPALLQTKAAELTAVDGEVRALADALDAGYDMLALVSAGIAGSCERCGSLLATNASYCSSCGAHAVVSLAGDAPADGQDGRSGAVAGSGSEPLEQQGRDLDLSTDEIEAVPRPQPEADREAEPEREMGPEPEREREVVPEPEAEVAEAVPPEPEVEPEPEAEVAEAVPPEPEVEPEPEAEAVPPAPEVVPPEPEVVPPEPEVVPPEPDREVVPEPEAEAVPAPEPVDEPDPPEPAAPTYPPPPPRRRRSGGAVGRVAGVLKRARKG